MMAMRRMIKGKSPEEIRELQKSDLEQPVSNHDFEEQNPSFLNESAFGATCGLKL